MKLFRDLSIRRKILILVLIISVATLSLGMFIENYYDTKRQQEAIINKTLFDALLISQYCGMPMEFENQEAAFSVLEKLEALPEIHNGLLFDVNDTLFAYYHKAETIVAKPPDDIKEKNYLLKGEWLHVIQPIVYKEKSYGYIYIRAFTNISEISKDRIIRQLVLIVAMILFALLLSGIFQRIITSPILELTDFTNEISTKRDYSLRIKKKNNDEIGKLYERFNGMLNVIETTKKELENHKEHLEELVVQRTKALKSTNKELLSAKEAAEKASKAKSEFLSNMSHELRTPLNGILGYAQILKTIGKLNDSQKEFVEIIYSSGKYLLDLISEILAYSKIEAKKFRLVTSNFSMEETIHQILNIIRIKAEQKDLALTLEKQTDFPGLVKGDEVKIRQVLLNLLSNAIKYTKRGKVVLRVLYNKEKSRNFTFEVEDTGIGIAKEETKQIFEPFTQIRDQLKYVEGTGLGLAITRQIIDLMDGRLEMESEPGEGSVFRVKLNMPEVTEISNKKRKQINIKGYKGNRKKILVVDDNLINLSFLVSALEPIGFELLIAESGKIAIEQAKQETPDLILMDLVMPVMSGTKTIKKIRDIPTLSSTKIVGVTASIIEHKELTEFIENCDSNIEKPVKLNELYKVIKEILNIEWIIEEENKPTFQQISDDRSLILPDDDFLSSIITLSEIGDFSSIEESLTKLTIDKKYFPFREKIGKFIEKYDSASLINYLNSLMA